MTTKLYQQARWLTRILMYTKSLYVKEQYTYMGLPPHWMLPIRLTPALEYKLNKLGLSKFI